MSTHEHEHHIATAGQLWLIGGALLVLTMLTVVVSSLPIPSPLDVIVALSIAVFKAFLVAAFFMGLWWDVKFNSMLIAGALVFFILMVCITLLDTMYRQDIVPSF